MTTEETLKYDMMVELGIATAEELNLVRDLVDGTWNEVLNAVCCIRTGYLTPKEYLEDSMREE